MAAKSKSLRSYAAKYACSHEQIRKIKLEGVDLEDETAVRQRLSADSVPSLPLTIPDSPQGVGLRAAIARLQAAEIAAHADYMKALETEPGAAGGRLKAWQGILESLRKAEVENPTIEKENAATVSKEELAKVLGELFKNLRMDLDALPRKIGLSAGDRKAAVEKTTEEEKNRIIDCLFACSYLKLLTP